MNQPVVIVGSANQDIIVSVPRAPLFGETILGSEVVYLPGGKGLNQASAASCAGAETYFVGALGADPAGQQLLGALRAKGVNVDNLCVLEGEATGTAHILVSDEGGNQIVVVPAANSRVTTEQAEAFIGALPTPGVLVLQGEIPLETTLAAAEAMTAKGGRTVFNFAPAGTAPARLFELSNPLVVNEFEAGLVLDQSAPTNAEEAMVALDQLLNLSPTVIVTLGGAGSVVGTADERRYLPAHTVDRVVDTTGAGDAFVGVLASQLAAGVELFEAAESAHSRCRSHRDAAGRLRVVRGHQRPVSGASSNW